MTHNSFRIAFLFPGQGSQAVGMGKELSDKYPVARRTFEEADDALGYKLSALCFEGPEEKLKLTEITQPAILTASVAAWRVLSRLIGWPMPEPAARPSARNCRPCGMRRGYDSHSPDTGIFAPHERIRTQSRFGVPGEIP